MKSLVEKYWQENSLDLKARKHHDAAKPYAIFLSNT